MKRIASATPWLERFRGLARELRGAAQFKRASRPRYCADVFLYRLLRVIPSSASDRLRTIELRDGTTLSYRRNRGDIQAIREIWLSPTYEPPPTACGLDVVVDLGANIGFTTLYLARRHGARTCVAVEPDAGNARLLRRNLEQNAISAIVLEVAVGREDGTALFARAHESNLGHLTTARDGIRVPVMSMPTVLERIGSSRVDLLKVDIEGGEGELFAGDTAWLDRVDAIMMEFHAAVTAPAPIVSRIEAHGLHHLPVRRGTTTSFVR